MLIDTDKLDWTKPIAFFDGASAWFPAVLVSTNMKYDGKISYYGVLVYRPMEQGGDILHTISDAGRVSTRRHIFNRADKPENPPIIEEEIKVNVKGLGDF